MTKGEKEAVLRSLEVVRSSLRHLELTLARQTPNAATAHLYGGIRGQLLNDELLLARVATILEKELP